MKSYNFCLTPQIVPSIETEHRLIHTSVPAEGTADLLGRLEMVESRSMHGQLPIVWDRAEDYNVYDHAGNRWIDFTSTIFVANVGHSNKKVTEAILSTLDKPLYSCYAYANPLRIKYLEKLIAFAGRPFEKAFLLSAGTEATEAVLKLLRMHGQTKQKRRLGIICIDNNWHGRTLGAQMMSSNLNQRAWIGYQDANIHHIPFPYPWQIGNQSGEAFLQEGLTELANQGIDITKDICGFMLETFQGWGAIFYPSDFVKSIEKICRENDILLAFDEMQAGFGRTGNMSSTHSANPMVCAAGLAVLEELESRNLIVEAERKGRLFREALESLQIRFSNRISWVLGNGMIFAILFKNPDTGSPDRSFASRVAELCMQKGLLVVHTGRESIKLGPPLTIPDKALLEGIGVIGEAINEVASL